MNITSSTLTGYAHITPFNVKEVDVTQIMLRRYWDMGDGTVYEGVQSVSHIYRSHGSYIITYNSVDIEGNKYVLNLQVDVALKIRDAVLFTQIPTEYADPGKPSDLFVVSVTCSQVDVDLYLNLHATNSKSLPAYSVRDNLWSDLIPKWSFLDKDFKRVESVKCDALPLTTYNEYDNLVTYAQVGSAVFRFQDDMFVGIPHKSNPLLLTATLQTSAFVNIQDSYIYNYKSFANSEVCTATIAWQVNYLPVGSIKINANLVTDQIPIQWAGFEIPLLITARVAETAHTPKNNTSVNFNYPVNNDTQESPLIIRMLSANIDAHGTEIFNEIDINLYKPPTLLSFENTDSEGVRSAGYIFTAIKPMSSFVCDNTMITCELEVVDSEALSSSELKEFAYPIRYAPQPVAWLGNNLEQKLTEIKLVPFPVHPDKTLQASIDKTIIGTIKTSDCSITKKYTGYNYQITGETGIHSIAVDPGEPNNGVQSTVVVVDSNLDCIYRVANDHTKIKTLQLSSVFTYDSLTQNVAPVGLAIDSKRNIWVSLFNKYDVLKFDSNFNLIASAIPVLPFNKDSQFDGDYNYKSPVIETDSSDNIWVAYNSILDNCVVKYDYQGKQLAVYELGKRRTCTGIVVDYNNEIWLSVYGSDISNTGVIINRDDSYIIHLDQNANIVEQVDLDCKNISHLTIDRKSNLWFVHGVRNIGYLDTNTKKIQSWNLNSSGTFNYITKLYSNPAARINEEIGGIAVDVHSRLWVLDSVYSNVHCFYADPEYLTTTQLSGVTTVTVNPHSHVSHFISANNIVTNYTHAGTKSLNANGDFTGNRWYQKYAKTPISYTISGSSETFKISDIYNNPYMIRRVNESFDMSEYINSLMLPEYMQDFSFLREKFIKAAVGDNATTYDNLGVKVYERIANFLSNTSDVETCNISQLQSLATMLGVKANIFNTNIPCEIQRMLDIFSIPRSSLMGFARVPLTEENINMQYTSVIGDGKSRIFTVNHGLNTVEYDLEMYLLNLDLGTLSYTFQTFDSNNVVIEFVGIPEKEQFSLVITSTPLTNDSIITEGEALGIINTYTGEHIAITAPVITESVMRIVQHEENVHTNQYKLVNLIDFLYSEDVNEFMYKYKVLRLKTVPNPVKEWYNNVIDWESPYTTVTHDLNDWYKDNGVAEAVFSALLTKYLFVSLDTTK